MRIVDCSRSRHRLGLSCLWTVYEKHGSLYTPVLRRKNIFTNDGLSQLASAPSGSYAAPVNLVIDNGGTSLYSGASLGALVVETNQRVDIAGDTQLVLEPGTASQELVTFVGTPTGSGPYIYTLSAGTVYAHSTGALVARQVNQNDTMTSVTSEIQFDPTDAPNQRVVSAGGYSGGAGNWVVQFYVTGNQALTTFTYIGISDSNTVGQGLLHNHLVLGYIHNSGVDVMIDGSLTLSNI